MTSYDPPDHSPNTVKTAVLLLKISSKRSCPVRQWILVPLFLKVAFISSTDPFSTSTMTPCMRKPLIISSDESWAMLICHTTIPVVLHTYLATEFTGTVWFWGCSKICAAVPADWLQNYRTKQYGARAFITPINLNYINFSDSVSVHLTLYSCIAIPTADRNGLRTRL